MTTQEKITIKSKKVIKRVRYDASLYCPLLCIAATSATRDMGESACLCMEECCAMWDGEGDSCGLIRRKDA